MMKRIFVLILALLATVSLSASGRIVERTYISTDRDVYVAGDVMWCSAFCVDAGNGGELSTLSSIVYLELHGAQGMVQNAKIALVDGRGGGGMTLSSELPTGNYKLVAYTAQNRNEVGYVWDNAATRTISVFNVFSNERVDGGVEILKDEEYASLPAPDAPYSGDLRIDVSQMGDGTSGIVLSGAPDATFSVSVFHDDGIRGDNGVNIGVLSEMSTLDSPVLFEENVIPDYEGEVIRGHLTGFSQDMLPKLLGKFAFISAPTSKSDVYSAQIDSSATVSFFTANIYGDKELVCEIEGIDSTLNCHIELESPFLNVPVSASAPLKMCGGLKDALTGRAVAMQVEKRFTADTLFENLPVRDNLLFEDECEQYILDDYTRFPLMEEVIVEFVSQMRLRRENGKRVIQLGIKNSFREYTFASGSSLLMLDGVPVFDHSKILQYDPLLVESINIYPYRHYVGLRAYDGIVNFVTYKKNLPSFKFNNNVRVLNYQGALVPMAYTCQGLTHGEYPDYRQTIYWHPLVSTDGEGVFSFDCTLPSYKGRFVVRVEGLASDGTPIYAEKVFEAK